jgi:hypothetical protein
LSLKKSLNKKSLVLFLHNNAIECGHCDFLKCPLVGWGSTEERNPKSNICLKLPGFSQFFHETWQFFEVFEIPKLNLEVL